MDNTAGRNAVQSKIGDFDLNLPQILPVFERTEPRTTHHWRNAIELRRALRRCRRQRIRSAARAGAMMLKMLTDNHRNTQMQK